MRAGDTVQITEPVGRHRKRVFRIVLDKPPSKPMPGPFAYLTGTRIRADGTPDGRSEPHQVYAVNEDWIKLETVTRLRTGQTVKILYPNLNNHIPSRRGFVIQDDGGPKVKVTWYAQDGPKIARNVVTHHGARHQQWIPRERLEPS
jgi:hypothetical protein